MDEERIRNVSKDWEERQAGTWMQFNGIESSPIWRGARRQIPQATALIGQMIIGAVFIGVRGPPPSHMLPTFRASVFLHRQRGERHLVKSADDEA